jgi:hypothetical protein
MGRAAGCEQHPPAEVVLQLVQRPRGVQAVCRATVRALEATGIDRAGDHVGEQVTRSAKKSAMALMALLSQPRRSAFEPAPRVRGRWW